MNEKEIIIYEIKTSCLSVGKKCDIDKYRCSEYPLDINNHDGILLIPELTAKLITKKRING